MGHSRRPERGPLERGAGIRPLEVDADVVARVRRSLVERSVQRLAHAEDADEDGAAEGECGDRQHEAALSSQGIREGEAGGHRNARRPLGEKTREASAALVPTAGDRLAHREPARAHGRHERGGERQRDGGSRLERKDVRRDREGSRVEVDQPDCVVDEEQRSHRRQRHGEHERGQPVDAGGGEIERGRLPRPGADRLHDADLPPLLRHGRRDDVDDEEDAHDETDDGEHGEQQHHCLDGIGGPEPA